MSVNLFEAYVKVGANTEEAEKGLSNVTEKGSALKTAFAGIGKATAAFGAAAGAAVTAAASAVGSLVKQSITAYAEMEQLVGGTRLLYGNAASWVEQRASEAYKNVQMSSADYLSQMNSFATGLKTSLGGDEQAAAELADKIVSAEADIVAATGASQESVSNAFVGLMRNNYTMLDNLQLGITPTKEGFASLIKTVNEYNKAQGKATDYQEDNLADMQAALIDYIGMQGIAGYAAMEGATTIEGATASMKAAWEDLVSGISDPDKDVGALVANLADSFTNVADLILPKIKAALPKVSKALTAMVTTLAPQLVSIVATTAPELANGIVEMLESAAENLPDLLGIAEQLISSLSDAIMQALPALGTIMGGIVDVLMQSLPELGTFATELVVQLGSYIANNASNLLASAASLLGSLVNGMIEAIPQIGSLLVTLIDNLFGEGGFLSADNLVNVALSGAEMLGHLFDNLTEAIVGLVGKLPEVIEGLVTGLTTEENLSKLAQGGADLIGNLFSNALLIAEALLNAAGSIITNFVENILNPEYLKKLINAGVELVRALFSGDYTDIIMEVATRFVTSLSNALGWLMPGMTSVASAMTTTQELYTAARRRAETASSGSSIGDQSRWVSGMTLNPYATSGSAGSTITINNNFDSTATPSEVQSRSRATLNSVLQY